MSSKILKAAVLASLLATPLMASADRAPGEMKGDWLIRAGMGVVNPKSENLQPSSTARRSFRRSSSTRARRSCST